MMVLVNASTLVTGGGVQVGASFIAHAADVAPAAGVQFHFAISPQVRENLPAALQSDSRITLIDVSPARPLRGWRSRRLLQAVERRVAADVVYSVGAPSYVRFRATEVARLAWAWATHPSSIAWQSLTIPKRVKRWLEVIYKSWWLRNVKYFETQSAVAAAGICRRFGMAPDRVRWIPNAFSPVYLGYPVTERPLRSETNSTVNVLTLSAAFPHKNLQIIPVVAALLKVRSPSTEFRFVVTLPPAHKITIDLMELARRMGVADAIENVGVQTVQQCPKLLDASDIVFLPTLLETFSVTYLEAMQMSRPIVTTDLDFAHDVCGDAALYYRPTSAESAAEQLMRLAADPGLYRLQVDRGRRRVRQFEGPQDKYARVVQYIKEVVQREAAS